MSSNTLSAVLEKLIHRLRLSDFPCGFGSWRKTENSTETEETDGLLDLLSCPHSPWKTDESWSPQVLALRQLAVLTPQHLHADFIYSYFTALRMVDKGISVIDDGLLKLSKLEELVLSVNKISDIPAENLPCTLKILELRANQLSALDSLTRRPPPHLEYLSLGSNSLGSHEDVSNLTGRHWPQLVCLDLGDCEFLDQQALLSTLSTLPRLRTLVLEGNPFTLASCYPGLTVDRLPQISCLDASWISPEERHRFRGMAKLSDLIMDRASATVNVGRMRGIPEPLSVDESTHNFPVVTYSYFITYNFLSHLTNAKPNFNSESDAVTTEYMTEDSSDADTRSTKNCEETSKLDTEELMRSSGETRHDTACVSRHSTLKLTWSTCMDFSDTQTYIVSDLGGLKRFLNQGLCLRIVEEKVLSWPAVSENITLAKTSRTVKAMKGRKGKESPIHSGSTKDKSKDKKRISIPELVQDAPVRRILGSVHVPLQSLIKGGQKIDVLCDFGTLYTESEDKTTPTLEKARLYAQQDLGEKIKECKTEDKGSKGTRQKNTAEGITEGKRKPLKKCKVDALTDNSVSVQLEPVTVELKVELEKWQSASEAHQLLLPHPNS